VGWGVVGRRVGVVVVCVCDSGMKLCLFSMHAANSDTNTPASPAQGRCKTLRSALPHAPAWLSGLCMACVEAGKGGGC